MTLRGGRLKDDLLRKVATFTSSIEQDAELADYDIRQSIAHAGALGAAGIMSEKESLQLIGKLRDLGRRLGQDRDALAGDYDDIHMAIEDRLGKLGKKLHAGRSRNDQVCCDMRMWARDSIKRMISGIGEVLEALSMTDESSGGSDILMPFYTHVQRAQAVSLSKYLDSYACAWKRDSSRFSDLLKRVNLLPLGSAAGASTSIKLDYERIAAELGFDGIMKNPMDAVASRDYILEFSSALTIFMLNVSRFAEDMVLFASREFAYVELDDSIAETSSIMPQKKNPDCFELLRSAAAGMIGDSCALFSMMKGLPMTYNRDMQDDRRIISQARRAEMALGLLPELLAHVSFDAAAMARAAKSSFTDAADLAEYLVLKGVDFRDAHRSVGELVRLGVSRGYSCLSDFSFEDLKQAVPRIEEDVFSYIDHSASVKRRLYEG